MTAVSSTQSVAKPGRFADAVELGARAAKVLERHGARESRLFSAVTAGEASGTLVLTNEDDDMEAYGAAGDELGADAEMLQLFDEARGPQSPIILGAQTVSSEIPLDRKGNPAHGNYVEVHIFRLTPGRLEDLLESSKRCADFVEGHGASNARLSSFAFAGQMSGALIFSWEVPTMRAQGALAEAWNRDPAGLALYSEFIGTNPSSTEIFSGLYGAIPI
jgi:hypothetical protein